MRQEPRLQFTKEERADPVLEKPIRKADRAADKAEKARAKIPKKKIRFEETVTDPATGKTVTRLRFEEVDKKKPPSKLSHAVRDAPGNAILSKVHKEIRESEEDNVGVESAHKMEEAAETGGRMIESAYHSHKLKPYREAAKAEKSWKRPTSMPFTTKACGTIPSLPAIRWPGGSKNTPSRNSMPLPSVRVRQQAALPKLRNRRQRLPKPPRKRVNRRRSSSGGTGGAFWWASPWW